MRAYLSLFFIFVAVIAQSDAFLQEKLSLLKNLKSGFEGGFGSGGSSGGSYGGGYNGGGYTYNPPSRPLYTGGESYGRSSYYNTGNVGGEQVIKVVKVIVPEQQTSYASSGYSSGAGYSTGWAQPQVFTPQPAPVQYRVQAAPAAYGAAQVQYTAPQPAPVQYRTVQLPPVQAPPVEYGAAQTATVQVQQPTTTEVQQPVQIQYTPPQQVVSTEQVVQPQPVTVTSSFHQPQQTVVKTLKLIVTEEDNGQLGYAPVSSSYGSGGYGANSAAWSQGQNNIGGNLWGKGFQRGGIWQKLGC